MPIMSRRRGVGHVGTGEQSKQGSTKEGGVGSERYGRDPRNSAHSFQLAEEASPQKEGKLWHGPTWAGSSHFEKSFFFAWAWRGRGERKRKDAQKRASKTL